MRILKFYYLLLLLSLYMSAQDTTWTSKPKVDFTGYIETFYNYNYKTETVDNRPSFLYNFNRNNEFNINLGLAKVAVTNTKYRANLAFQTGTYATDNYGAEDDAFRYVNEANVGISLNAKNNLWLDAGVFSSYIGFESAIGANNLTLTRSILAENSPYFLTGAKLTFDPNEKISISVLVLNGWQRIKKLAGNSLLSFGTQVVYKPSDKLLVNWSTFIGTDSPDEERKMRYFNNLYSQWKATDKLNFTFGFDIGVQQKEKDSNRYYSWYAPIIISQYKLTEQWTSALRIEYYSDKNNVIVNPIVAVPTPFEINGTSLNFDYNPFKIAKIRFEAKYLNATEAVFDSNADFKKNNLSLTTSLSLQF